MELKKEYSIILRYLVLFLLTFSLPLFYFILKPLTIMLSESFLSLFYKVLVIGELIIINDYGIRIVPACIAASAYILLLILNIATPMKNKKRYVFILASFICFFIMNLIRIITFSILFINDFTYFDMAHSLTWHIFSTILVVLIWFLFVRVFKIKSIPFYSDFKYFYSLTIFSKNQYKTPKLRKNKSKKTK